MKEKLRLLIRDIISASDDIENKYSYESDGERLVHSEKAMKEMDAYIEEKIEAFIESLSAQRTGEREIAEKAYNAGYNMAASIIGLSKTKGLTLPQYLSTLSPEQTKNENI